MRSENVKRENSVIYFIPDRLIVKTEKRNLFLTFSWDFETKRIKLVCYNNGKHKTLSGCYIRVETT